MQTLEKDDVHAFNEQWKDVESRYNPAVITLERVKPPAGVIAHIHFTVDLSKKHHPVTDQPSMLYAHRANDPNLFTVSKVEGDVDILEGFPETRPRVRFHSDCIPFHINVFASGGMCIGNSDLTVLSIMFDNIFRALIYDPDPSVANYDSVANRETIEWQQEKEQSKEFPILNPQLLFRQSAIGLPPVIVKAKSAVTTAPALAPIRR